MSNCSLYARSSVDRAMVSGTMCGGSIPFGRTIDDKSDWFSDQSFLMPFFVPSPLGYVSTEALDMPPGVTITPYV